MRASLLIIMLLAMTAVSAAPHVTITYSIDTNGTLEVISLEGSDRTFTTPAPGEEIVRWMAYSEGIRTASIDDRFSFDLILDTFDESGGEEITHGSLAREVHVPIRATTDTIIAYVNGTNAVTIDFAAAMCSDACPSCRMLFDDACADPQAISSQESERSREPIDPFWIIIILLGVVVLIAYGYLILKLRKR